MTENTQLNLEALLLPHEDLCNCVLSAEDSTVLPFYFSYHIAYLSFYLSFFFFFDANPLGWTTYIEPLPLFIFCRMNSRTTCRCSSVCMLCWHMQKMDVLQKRYTTDRRAYRNLPPYLKLDNQNRGRTPTWKACGIVDASEAGSHYPHHVDVWGPKFVLSVKASSFSLHLVLIFFFISSKKWVQFFFNLNIYLNFKFTTISSPMFNYKKDKKEQKNNVYIVLYASKWNNITCIQHKRNIIMNICFIKYTCIIIIIEVWE